MAPPVEISIPSTTLSSPTGSKPFTLYNITLRLPLRSFVVQKRYSEFTSLDSTLRSLASSPPPASLPSKSWFKSTTASPELTESRRKDLETYLRAIAESPDRRWRDTSAWRAFLNLPSSAAAANSSRATAHATITSGTGATDPTVWLDQHRELKGQLQDARLHLGRRDGATTAHGQHEAGTNAKRCLVKAGGLLGSLEDGLRAMTDAEKSKDVGWGASVGEGELRRRKDLLASARVEKDGLEKLSLSLAAKGQNGNSSGGPATQQDHNTLFGPGASRPGGRVLGAPVPETERTRELDNEGVLMLQKQMMQNQDLDVEELAKIVRRQKAMGLAINDELELQNEMLKRVDEDASRVNGKIQIAKKRVAKIS